MMFSTVTFVLASALVAYAADINVLVGAGNELVFQPTSVTASNGDTIHFEFTSKNHSVTQSTFGDPCTQAPSGIDSGFQLVAADATSHPSWSFTVNNASTPLWFFCAQTNPSPHCKAGMVFAVNPTADKSFNAFQANAMGNAGTGTSGSAGATGASGVVPAPTSLPTQAGGGVSPPSGNGFSTVNTGATTSGSAQPAASTTTTPNSAVVMSGLSSAGAVSIVSLIAAVAGFML